MRRRVVMGLASLFSLALAATSLAQTAGTTKADAPAKAAPAKKADTKSAAAKKGADAGASSTDSTSSADAGATTAMAGDAGIAPSATPAPTSGSVATAATMDGSTYQVRLRDLEAHVDELKDQIRRSHTRLALLSDTIMSGGVAGSRADILFKNEMSSAFRLVRAAITLDGAIQYNRQDDTGALAEQKEISVFTGSVPPGDHTVGISLTFQGNGYGVFTYLKSYKFDVQNNHSFTSVEGKTMQITATALEKGGVTTPLNERPTVQWQENATALGATAPVAASAPAGNANASANGSASGAKASGGISVGGGTK